MNRIFLPCAVVVMASALFSSCANPPRSIYGPQGFAEAYYDAATLTTITNGANCVRVRIYNSRRTANDTKGTTMAIGVSAAQGPELNMDPTFKYQQYNALSGSRTSMNALTKAAALTACNYVVSAGDELYKAEFLKDQVLNMLRTAGCNGLKVSAVRLTDGKYSMSIVPVSIANGSARVIDDAVPLVCTDPCPSLCGPPENYVK